MIPLLLPPLVFVLFGVLFDERTPQTSPDMNTRHLLLCACLCLSVSLLTPHVFLSVCLCERQRRLGVWTGLLARICWFACVCMNVLVAGLPAAGCGLVWLRLPLSSVVCASLAPILAPPALALSMSCLVWCWLVVGWALICCTHCRWFGCLAEHCGCWLIRSNFQMCWLLALASLQTH